MTTEGHDWPGGPENPGCHSCEHLATLAYRDEETGRHLAYTEGCFCEENHELKHLWWGDHFYPIDTPSNLNKNRDCPRFEQKTTSEESKEELLSIWSHIKGWFRRKND
jgi:hypothetical protein